MRNQKGIEKDFKIKIQKTKKQNLSQNQSSEVEVWIYQEQGSTSMQLSV